MSGFRPRIRPQYSSSANILSCVLLNFECSVSGVLETYDGAAECCEKLAESEQKLAENPALANFLIDLFVDSGFYSSNFSVPLQL